MSGLAVLQSDISVDHASSSDTIGTLRIGAVGGAGGGSQMVGGTVSMSVTKIVASAYPISGSSRACCVPLRIL